MEVECLAACGFPTAVQINSRYFENVTPSTSRRSWPGSGRR
jgi:NADH:ubiquinone oxidoreductase subunit E